MINPLKLNKSDINKEVFRVTREGNLLSKDSVLYHLWRIFWVTEDVIDRIKVIRVRESENTDSLYTKGSLHPINSISIHQSEKESTIAGLDRDKYDYALFIQDGTLINHFMDFWIYVNYQIYLMDKSHAGRAENEMISLINLKAADRKAIAFIEEFQRILLPEADASIHKFIRSYHDYSLQRVYLLNNDSLDIEPYHFEPEELFCVSSGIKPVHYFQRMKNSLKTIHFCDYSPLALHFWRELIECRNMHALLHVFEKYSPNFIGTSDNAMEAVKLVLNHQIETYFQSNENFFNLLSQMKTKANFLQVNIIEDLDFLQSAKGSYYFWFSNSFERNLTLLQESKSQHHEDHLKRLQRLKAQTNERIFYNTTNYDFRIGDLNTPRSIGTQDIPEHSALSWREL